MEMGILQPGVKQNQPKADPQNHHALVLRVGSARLLLLLAVMWAEGVILGLERDSGYTVGMVTTLHHEGKKGTMALFAGK